MDNSIALITGANRGIGFQTARLLGIRGMTVLVGARDETRGRDAERALRENGLDATFVPLDVTDEKTIHRAAEWIDGEYGRLDVLVNNAGIVRTDGSPSDTTLERLREVYETNVFGVVATTNAMMPLLRRASSPRLVNVSSEVGSITSMTNPDSPLWQLCDVPYPSSKSALNMVTAMYAKQLRDTPFKVNAANPGYCATDFNDNSGFRTAEQGAEVAVQLAVLPPDGPSGVLWGDLSMAPGHLGRDEDQGEGQREGVLSW